MDSQTKDERMVDVWAYNEAGEVVIDSQYELGDQRAIDRHQELNYDAVLSIPKKDGDGNLYRMVFGPTAYKWVGEGDPLR